MTLISKTRALGHSDKKEARRVGKIRYNCTTARIIINKWGNTRTRTRTRTRKRS